MVPTEILLMYLVAVVFALVAVLVYFSAQRQPVNITIICGGQETKTIREGIVNGSGLLIRCRNGDFINLGPELQKGLKVRLVQA